MLSRFKIFSRIVMLMFFLPCLTEACEAGMQMCMQTDGYGNTYTIWLSGNRSNQLYAAITASDNSAWNQTLIASEVSKPGLAVSSTGNTIVTWISVDPETSNYCLHASLLIDGKWQPPQAISCPKDAVIGNVYTLAITDEGYINIMWPSNSGMISASATFEHKPTWTLKTMQ